MVVINLPIKKIMLQKSLDDLKAQCLTCSRHCIINNLHWGFCRTRFNLFGEIYNNNYGIISSISNNPIEKKPFFHFYPGSYALTIGGFSCNFSCSWCQNYDISTKIPKISKSSFKIFIKDLKNKKNENTIFNYEFYDFNEILKTLNQNQTKGLDLKQKKVIDLDDYYTNYYCITPNELIDYCNKNKTIIQGTSVSFNEPTLSLEYSLDLFKIAHENGFYNTYISNGYMSQEALDLLIKSNLDALKIDIKGPPEIYEKIMPNADWKIPWQNANYALKNKIHVEIVCLLVSDICDNEEFIDFVIENHLKYLDENVPLHFTRYFPAYNFHNEPTNLEFLKMARKRAINAGIKFVYSGNIFHDDSENTYCPNCNSLLIERKLYDIRIAGLKKIENKSFCVNCGSDIPILI